MTDTYVIDAKGRAVIDKDVNGKLDYPFRWSDWLTPLADTISNAEFSITGGTATIDLAKSGFDTTTAVVWVQGGQVGETNKVDCKITTAAGRVDSRSIYIKVKDK